MYNLENENVFPTIMLQPLHAILTLKPFSTGEETFFGWSLPVILLQNVMVSPGIDLVKNQEFQSTTSES